jgi:hypothetical protein
MSSDLKNKMLQWETRPPNEAWNRIAASLDTDDEYSLSQKLSTFQSLPPMHVWENIEAELEAHEPSRVISFYKKHKLALHYSGAAAALIFAAVLISLTVSKKTVSSELTQRSSMQSIPQLQGDYPAANSKDVRTDTNDHIDSQNFSGQQSTDIIAGVTANSTTKHSSKTSFNKIPSSGYRALMAEWKQAKDSLVNHYFVHTDQRGASIRFSSKLYDLLECSDEWTESECAQQIKLWQQKAATSAMYASADFTGVLEILKSMEEGK